MPEQIWPNNDPPPFRRTRAAEVAAAATETEAEAEQVEAQDVQDGKAKQEPEGGYVDTDDEAAAAKWSTESSTPPPPTSPTSTASQPQSPASLPMPSQTPSPPASPEASPTDGTETCGNKCDSTSNPALFQLRSDIQVSRVRSLLCDANNLEKKKNFQTIQHLVTQIKIRK